MESVPILVILGSKSDGQFARPGIELLENYNIPHRVVVYSVHREPDKLEELLKLTEGVKVIIAVAGLSAALPGIIAGLVKVPVIGVPRDVGPLNGLDALFSISQMPRGVPVGTMAIGEHGMVNGVLYALRILGLTYDWARKALDDYESTLRR